MPSTNARSPRLGQILAHSALVALLMVACQSNEERTAALFEEAQTAIEAGDADGAAILYRKLLQIDPNHAGAHLGLANAYVTQDKGREALWEYAEAVRLDGANEAARLGLGALSLMRRDFDEALEQADAVHAANPSSVSALLMRGQALEGLERGSEAEASYLNAVELAGEQGEELGPTLFVLGTYYRRMGDRVSAEPPLVKYTEIDPSYASYTALGRFLGQDESRDDETVRAFEMALETAKEAGKVIAYKNLASFQFSRGRTSEAKRVLEQGIAEFQNDPDRRVELMYVLARYHGELGEREALAALVEATSQIQPGDPKPHLILADYRSRNGDLEGALEAIERALQAEPGHTNSTLRKAELLTDLGFKTDDPQRIAQGIAIVDEVLADEPTNSNALFLKGKAALALGDPEEAIRQLRASIDASPGSAFAHLALGNALAQTGNLSAARAEVSRAVELDETLVEARKQLAKLHAALGEHEYAVEQARTYLSANPNDAEMLLLIAQSLATIGRPQDALEAVESLDVEAEGAQAHFAKGRLLLASGDAAAARDELRRANELSPHHPTILRILMNAEQRLGNIRAIQPDIEAAWQAQPESSELARVRGIYALRTGDTATAQAMFQRATELDATNVAAYRQLAGLHLAAGRNDEARSTYQHAIAVKPDSAQLRHALAALDEREGRIEDAIAGYDKAIALDSGMAQSKNNLAYLLAESGQDLERALDLAQEAKAALPESASAADTLGWVLYRRGVPSAAVGYLREAVAGMEVDSEEIGVVRQHLAFAYEANDQKQLAIDTLELSLRELEASQRKLRADGTTPQDPEWATSAREMLARLKPTG